VTREIMREILRRDPEGWMLSYDAEVIPLRAKALGQAITGLGKGLGPGSHNPPLPAGVSRPAHQRWR
jgi:hypothetical protein